MKKFYFSLLMLFVAAAAYAQTPLSVGDKAPMFGVPADNDQLWKLADYVGKKNIVIFFYPAAMTGGCTAQACSYRDELAGIEAHDAIVLGISGDDVAALKVFKKAHQLNYPLLSDFNGAVAALYGVPTRDGGVLSRIVDETEFQLTRGVTASRWTFIIGKDGNIRYVNQQVDAANDSKAVLEILSKN